MISTPEPPARSSTPTRCCGYQRAADAVYVDPQIIEYAVRLSTATRDLAAAGLPELARYVSFGASPRASINMVLGAKALAFLRGRDYALPTDVRELARDVLRHRVVLSYEALADGVSPDDLLGPLLAAVPLPEIRCTRTRSAGARTAMTARHRTAALTPERVLRRLEWRVIRRLDGRLQGDYRTVFRGTGVDVVDLREYQPGDDLRHVDWNVTARTDVPHVREYLEDREVTAWLLLDRSASMEFGPVRAAQAPRAGRGRRHRRAAAVPRRQPGRRACCSTPGCEEIVPPGHGRNQVLRILARLLPPPRAPRGRRPARDGPRRPPTWRRRRCARRARHRAPPVAGRHRSDFISEPGWEPPLGLLARRHDVVALQVVDRRESSCPPSG